MGRICVGNDSRRANIVYLSSELAIAGRPLQEGPVVIPKQKHLILPESLKADEDIRVAERSRPGPATISAQKGVDRLILLWETYFKGINHNGPKVIISCGTGYIEDPGAAVLILDSDLPPR